MSDTRQSDARLHLDGLVVGFDGAAVTGPVSLELRPGEMVSLRGPSGGGKTTLLRAVAGLIDPLAGSVRLDGRGPDEVGYPAWRRRVLYVAQEPVLTAPTVLACLEEPFGYRHVELSFDRRRAEQLLGAVGLGDVLAEVPRELSVGQRQRVSLVRSLLLCPDVLLLDEPTSALDDASEAAVAEVLGRMLSDGQVSALVALHDSRGLSELAHTQLELTPGKACVL